MNAEAIAMALGGRKTGGGWMAHCPAHEDREPSLSITDARGGKVLVRCHAGCDQKRIITALRARGLWGNNGHRRFPHFGPGTPVFKRPDRGDVKRTEIALSMWNHSRPASGTPVESYLRSRGLRRPTPRTIRFHPALKHPSGGFWPGMVSLVTRGADDLPLAIHRTFLARDGGLKAPVDPVKMMLGPCRGGVVCLAEPGEVLMVGEGIETCLAAMQATGRAAWAALSTSGLRALDLPNDVRDVVVLADGDEPGEAAARDCAWRWKRQGRRVRIARPPQGMDFNDMLTGHVPCIEERAP